VLCGAGAADAADTAKAPVRAVTAATVAAIPVVRIGRWSRPMPTLLGVMTVRADVWPQHCDRADG
jgi:hypothetical protein